MSSTTTLFLVDPRWETFLREELQRTKRGCETRRIAPAWLSCKSEWPTESRPAIALAQQTLSQAEPLATPSISKAAQQVGERIVNTLANCADPWRLHVFTATGVQSSASARRCELIAEAIDKYLAKHLRRLRRSRVEDSLAPWQENEWFIQLGLVTAEQGWYSCATPQQRQQWQCSLSRFPGGQVECEHDLFAPSRAHGKLVEAELQWGEKIQPGQTCVDLGASPGGWTYLAVQRGAEVIAVDRAELRGDLMRHSLVEFVQADAFRYTPPAQVDWLLCDLIAFPEKTLELLRHWLENRLCRRFCVTVKFRSDEHYGLLDEFKKLLHAHAEQFMIRCLRYNKNEVTVMGSVPPA